MGEERKEGEKTPYSKEMGSKKKKKKEMELMLGWVCVRVESGFSHAKRGSD